MKKKWFINHTDKFYRKTEEKRVVGNIFICRNLLLSNFTVSLSSYFSKWRIAVKCWNKYSKASTKWLWSLKPADTLQLKHSALPCTWRKTFTMWSSGRISPSKVAAGKSSLTEPFWNTALLFSPYGSEQGWVTGCLPLQMLPGQIYLIIKKWHFYPKHKEVRDRWILCLKLHL